MQHRKLLLVFTVLVVTAVAIVGAGCGGKKAEKATQPTLHVGDRWAYTLTSNVTNGGQTYALTEEVTGEESVDGKGCYVLEASFSPPYNGFMASAKLWVEKATFDTLKIHSSWEEQSTVYTLSGESSYQGKFGFPLEVGKEGTCWKRTRPQ